MITAKTKDGESAIEIQGRKVWITRGSRLEAARRLERTGKSSSWVVLLSSLALVAVSIALFLPETSIHASARAFAELGALVGSVAILLVGIVEQGKSYELRADRHHRAAMELNQLSDRIRASASATAEEFAEVVLPRNHGHLDQAADMSVCSYCSGLT